LLPSATSSDGATRPGAGSGLAPLAGGALGFLAGLACWFLCARFLLPLVAPAQGPDAAAGLISRVVLDGYDKAQETRAFLLGTVLVPLGLWLGWRLAGGVRTAPEPAPAPLEPAGGWLRYLPWALMGAVALLSAGTSDLVRQVNPWSSFGFEAEEGVYLGAVQALRTGRVLYTDLAFPYGPVMIHGLDLWLRIFGDTVAAARALVLVLHGLGILTVGLTVRLVVGGPHAAWAGLAAAAAAAVVYPPFVPHLNSVLLRPCLGLLPGALLLAACRRTAGVWRFAAGGALLALGGLFSFDVAAVALATALVALVAGRAPLRGWLAAGAGAVAAAALLLWPVLLSGAVGDMLAQAFDLLSLSALGYQALPYPDLAGLFVNRQGVFGAHAPADLADAAWSALPPLAVWAALGVALCGPGLRQPGRRGLLVAAVASALLFRGALGRSDLYHLWFYGAVPMAVLPLTLALTWNARRWTALAAAGLLVAGLALLDAPGRTRTPLELEQALSRRQGVTGPLTPTEVTGPRIGAVRMRPRLARQVKKVTARAAALPPGDGVMYYPLEGIYYFLSDRPLPTRHVQAFDAATREGQWRTIADLERTKPRWVFRFADLFRVDGIPQEKLVPLVHAYLKKLYRPKEDLGGVVLMQRIQN